MRRSVAGSVRALLMLTLLALVAPVAAGENAKTLHVYTWLDYFDPYSIELFEEEFGCKVEFDYFDTPEMMFARVVEKGDRFDLITPPSFLAAALRREGLILDLDHAKLPALENIDRSVLVYTEDPEMRFSVPYTMNVTGVGYDDKFVPEDALGSWDIFSNPDFAGRATMIHDPREFIGAALKLLGYSLNTTNDAELEATREILRGWRKNLGSFEVDAARLALEDDVYILSQSYSGDITWIMMEKPSIKFYVPKEGASLTTDDFVITADCSDPDLAHAFINHFLRPHIAKLNMEEVAYYMPNPAALAMVDEELMENPAFNVPADILVKCEPIRDLGDYSRKYEALWQSIVYDTLVNRE